MKQKTAMTRRLRHSSASAFVALFAMALQLLLAMEHASAMAVAAARGGANGSPLGILEICTARGLLRIPAPAGMGLDEQPSPRPGTSESCAICGTAAVSGASDAPASALTVAFPHLLKATVAPPTDREHRSAGFKRSGTTRGPPQQATRTC